MEDATVQSSDVSDILGKLVASRDPKALEQAGGFINLYSNESLTKGFASLKDRSDKLLFLSHLYTFDPYLHDSLRTERYRKLVLDFIDKNWDNKSLEDFSNQAAKNSQWISNDSVRKQIWHTMSRDVQKKWLRELPAFSDPRIKDMPGFFENEAVSIAIV